MEYVVRTMSNLRVISNANIEKRWRSSCFAAEIPMDKIVAEAAAPSNKIMRQSHFALLFGSAVEGTNDEVELPLLSLGDGLFRLPLGTEDMGLFGGMCTSCVPPAASTSMPSVLSLLWPPETFSKVMVDESGIVFQSKVVRRSVRALIIVRDETEKCRGWFGPPFFPFFQGCTPSKLSFAVSALTTLFDLNHNKKGGLRLVASLCVVIFLRNW